MMTRTGRESETGEGDRNLEHPECAVGVYSRVAGGRYRRLLSSPSAMNPLCGAFFRPACRAQCLSSTARTSSFASQTHVSSHSLYFLERP